MTATATGELYYDPYDVDIDADPYPVFRRLREEAPLYYNERFDFYALSRFDDVERGLVDRDTYISGRGGILELIKANIEMPPGARFPEWDVDWEGARLAPTSTVRGWETLPVVIS